MNNNATPVEILFEKADQYRKTTFELIKLNAIDKSADIASFLAIQFVVFIVVALFTLIANIGVALWLGEKLGKSYYGFFVIAGFYAVIGIMVYALKNTWIKPSVRESVISNMLKKKDNEDQE